MLMLLLVSNVCFVGDEEAEDVEVVGEGEDDDEVVGEVEESVLVAGFEAGVATRNMGGARIAGG